VGTPPGADEADEGTAGEGAGKEEWAFLRKERVIMARVLIVCFVLCLLTALAYTVSVHAAANLVVTSVSGPAKAFLNQTVSVKYEVQNQGDVDSGAYEVGLYLSRDKTIGQAKDHLLKKMSFVSGLAAGKTRKTTAKVTMPNYHVNGLSKNYYYGVVVKPSAKASSEQVAIIRYEDSGDGTVADHKTDLTWQKTDDGVQRNWADGGAYCRALELGGHGDWRLPSIEALWTIMDSSRLVPATDSVFDCQSEWYWASTTLTRYPDYAWRVHFGNGMANHEYKPDYYHYVRCVRGGP
jgi:hypothetical protein